MKSSFLVFLSRITFRKNAYAFLGTYLFSFLIDNTSFSSAFIYTEQLLLSTQRKLGERQAFPLPENYVSI